eukprot:10277-Eustigmatos_ZCMA.PRE.1
MGTLSPGRSPHLTTIGVCSGCCLAAPPCCGVCSTEPAASAAVTLIEPCRCVPQQVVCVSGWCDSACSLWRVYTAIKEPSCRACHKYAVTLMGEDSKVT